MQNKTLIISLILQEFKYFKLARGLENLSLQMYDATYPDATEMIASLMGIEARDISNAWSDIYMKYLDDFESVNMKDEAVLKRIAEECYASLQIQVEEERGDG